MSVEPDPLTPRDRAFERAIEEGRMTRQSLTRTAFDAGYDAIEGQRLAARSDAEGWKSLYEDEKARLAGLDETLARITPGPTSVLIEVADLESVTRRAEAAEARVAELERERNENFGTIKVICKTLCNLDCENGCDEGLEYEGDEWVPCPCIYRHRARLQQATEALRELNEIVRAQGWWHHNSALQRIEEIASESATLAGEDE